MCSIIEIHTPTEFTIRYETEDSLNSQRLQRTRNLKLIRGRPEDASRDGALIIKELLFSIGGLFYLLKS